MYNQICLSTFREGIERTGITLYWFLTQELVTGQW